jgi:hypothetical protein
MAGSWDECDSLIEASDLDLQLALVPARHVGIDQPTRNFFCGVGVRLANDVRANLCSWPDSP